MTGGYLPGVCHTVILEGTWRDPGGKARHQEYLCHSKCVQDDWKLLEVAHFSLNHCETCTWQHGAVRVIKANKQLDGVLNLNLRVHQAIEKERSGMYWYLCHTRTTVHDENFTSQVVVHLDFEMNWL